MELYFVRDEGALEQIQAKYAPWCRTIAGNILGEDRDVEECLSDCWLQPWNAIPLARPEHFQGYLGAVVRNRALAIRSQRARGADTVNMAALELEQCLPRHDGPEGQAEAGELGRAISAFLRTQKQETRVAFVRRYWYADTVEQTVRHMGWSASKTKSVLFRTRKRLWDYLKKGEWL